MTTIRAINDRLIAQAVKLGKHKTKKAAVTTALREYIKSRKRLRILDMFGKVNYWPGYDYKAARRRDNKRIPKSQPSRHRL